MPSLENYVPTLADVRSAANRIDGLVHRTDVMTSSSLDHMSGKKLFFKTELFQKTGSFKARGALNAIKRALEINKNLAGIVTHSSGNHGQAVAWASRQLSLPCTVVVPKGTPNIKCEAIRGYGAELVFCEPTPTSRKETCAKIAREKGMLYISSSDDYNVIAGQGTIGLELLNQVPDLDAIIVPISGGGMASGISIAAAALKPDCKIICVEPLGKNLWENLQARQRLWPNPPEFLDTIAEGLKLQQTGYLTFPILCDHVDGVVTVNNKQISSAMRLVAERMKLVVETASGAAVAAAMSEDVKRMEGVEKIGVILCGGNSDVDKLPWMK